MKNIQVKPTWRKVSHLKGPLGVEEIFEVTDERKFVKTIVPSEFSDQITARKLVGESRSKTGFPSTEEFLRASIAETGLPRPYNKTRTIPQVPVDLYGKYAALLQANIDQDPHTQQFAALWLEKNHSDAANRLIHQVIPQAIANQLEFAIGYNEDPFAGLAGINFGGAANPFMNMHGNSSTEVRTPKLFLFRAGHNEYDGYHLNEVFTKLLAPIKLTGQQDSNQFIEQLFTTALQTGLIWSSAHQAQLDNRAVEEERDPPGAYLRKLLEREQLEAALPPPAPSEVNSGATKSRHGYL